jgi:serine/threonine-protein kinase
MGAVYDALQVRLNKRVAIKVMARELATNAEALNRFHREAMITSGLGHPHIVQVFDFSTTPLGQPFLAMEFLEGEDLDHRIARVGHLSPAETIHIVKQVASALAATHAQQIVHRDLKPANIYLLNVAGEDDFVKVLDFGISKMRATTTKLTKASALIGTPDYMSPEQAMGDSDDVDGHTDQWALACIAWECLCGKSPFCADSIPSMLFQVVHRDPPPLASKVNGLPQDIETVLRRALAKNKDDRFPTVIEFAHALEAALLGTAPVHVTEEARPETATYPSASDEDRSERPTTTFSQAAQETEGEKGDAPVSRTKWIWAVAGAGAVALSLVAFLVIRPGPTSKRHAPSVASPASAIEPAAAVPVPAAAPVPAVELQPAPTAAIPTSAVPVPAPPPATTPKIPTPAAEAVGAPVAGNAKTGQPEGAADNTLPASTDVNSKPRTKRAASVVRSKSKSSLPEHRLIKEL